MKKSMWNDFLMLIGIIPLRKSERVEYSTGYLILLSESDMDAIKRDSVLMQKIIEN